MDLIAEYDARAGALRYWPHHAMNRFATHAMKYKVNYAVKGFLLWNLYMNWRTLDVKRSRMILTLDQQARH